MSRSARVRISTCLGIIIIAAFGRAEAARAMSPETLHIMRRLVIQHNGRHKRFDSLARETVRAITGARRWQRQDPVETVLDIIIHPEMWQERPLIEVPFVPLREALGMDRHTTHTSQEELVTTRRLMRMLPGIVEKQQNDDKLTMLENETMEAFQRFVTFSGLVEHRLELVPPPHGTDPVWQSILQPQAYHPDAQDTIRAAWAAFITAGRSGDETELLKRAEQLSTVLRTLNPQAYPSPWRIELELFYNRAEPFVWAIWCYLLAALSLLLYLVRPSPGAARVGVSASAAAYVFHIAGIAMRVILGGRPPVSNFFETMLWLPFVTMTLALVFDRIYRAYTFRLAATSLAAITLTLARQVPLDSSITPVVAVLRSNLWLTVHVLTIVASYGALALATGLAHVYGFVYLLRGERHRALKPMGLFLYRAIHVGVVLLASGVMLGAVWANASWGRYWGWDPKETWALITLLWFLALLHGRFAGWLHALGLATGTIVGFFLLLMTYYGVSFYLVGLHSYAGGSAKPLPLGLVIYVAAEVLFVAALAMTAANRRRLKNS